MRKGAISPIADDIPSIFPIVASVLLFLGAVAYAGGVVNERNNYLDIRKAGLGLSDVVLAKGYLGNDEFLQQCSVSYREFAKRKAIKFLISLKKFCRYVDFSSAQNPASEITRYPPSFNTGFTSFSPPKPGAYVETKGEVCENNIAATNPSCFDPFSPSRASNCPKNYQTLVFPIAIDCKDATQKGTGIVTIIVWR